MTSNDAKDRDETNGNQASLEMLVFWGSSVLAVILISLGIYFARRTGDHHWVNRFGAAIVAAEGIMLILDHIRRKRLSKVANQRSSDRLFKKAVNHEIEKAERQLVMMTVSLMVIGQMLHGFGDLIFGLLFCPR